jgi:hypothetical protein
MTLNGKTNKLKITKIDHDNEKGIGKGMDFQVESFSRV